MIFVFVGVNELSHSNACMSVIDWLDNEPIKHAYELGCLLQLFVFPLLQIPSESLLCVFSCLHAYKDLPFMVNEYSAEFTH